MKIIDDDVFDAILEAIGQGADLQSAVVSNAYNLHLFMRHLEVGAIAYRNEAASGRKVKVSQREQYFLYVKVQEARAKSAKDLIRRVRSSEDWKAARWLLEAQHQETHGTYATLEASPHAPMADGGTT